MPERERQEEEEEEEEAASSFEWPSSSLQPLRTDSFQTENGAMESRGVCVRVCVRARGRWRRRTGAVYSRSNRAAAVIAERNFTQAGVRSHKLKLTSVVSNRTLK